MHLKSFPIFDWKAQVAPVVGCDEAGRGCLAGPVCAAAVILKDSADPKLFTDSKLLSAKRRDELYDVIYEHAIVGVGFASVQEIEKINILKASLLAMKRSVEALKVQPGCVLVDGKFIIPGVKVKQHALIKGELRASPIAAASIIAKVSRDRVMDELDERFPSTDTDSTRDTLPRFIERRLKSLGPRSTIDSVSLACANSSAAHLLRARRAEKRVAEYFLKQKHLLLFHNKKIAGVEIDLVFWDRSGNIIFVEVKSLSRRGLMPYRLTKAQTDRLYKAKTFFESIYQFSVEVRLVMVNTAQEELIDLVIL